MPEKENLMEQFGISDEREWKIFSKGIEVGKEHQEPSPDTIDMIEEINNKIKCNDDDHKEFRLALFGDKEKGEKGMKEMISEIYTIYSNTGFTGKFILRIFAIIGIVTGAIIGMIELFKRIR